HAASGSEGDGVVTFAEAFTVQPFANTVNLQTFTGAQLIQALKEQVSGPNEAAPKILQVSSGLTYTLDLTRTGADRVVTDSIELDGSPIDPSATYRVATNSFLAGGGDGFPTLGEGTGDLVGADDLTALEQYLTANSSASAPLAPPAADRITIVQCPLDPAGAGTGRSRARYRPRRMSGPARGSTAPPAEASGPPGAGPSPPCRRRRGRG